MLASILESIFSALLSAVFKPITDWLTKRANIKQGQAQQAAAETAASLSAETAIAQAETDGPETIDDAIAAAKQKAAGQ